jgi:hypothetical protein
MDRQFNANRASLAQGRPQAAFSRLAIFLIVARLQPVACCMLDQLAPASSMRAMPELRSAFSGRPW